MILAETGAAPAKARRRRKGWSQTAKAVQRGLADKVPAGWASPRLPRKLKSAIGECSGVAGEQCDINRLWPTVLPHCERLRCRTPPSQTALPLAGSAPPHHEPGASWCSLVFTLSVSCSIVRSSHLSSAWSEA